MIGVVLVTHDGLADGLAKSLFHVLGPEHPCFECIGVARDDPVEDVRQRVAAAVRRVERDEGVLILSDLFGGTPANVAMSLVEPGRVEMLSGVSLPMLVRVMSARQDGLEASVARAIQGGREGIIRASEMLALWQSCEDGKTNPKDSGADSSAT